MDLSYFTSPNSSFGTPEWVFFIAQFVVALAGAYLTFMRADTHAVRGPALRNLGYALLILGILGAIVGALRRSNIAPFTAPYWMTIVTVLALALIIYALYYALAVYPGRVAAWEAAQRGRGGRSSGRPSGRAQQQAIERSAGDASASTNGAARPVGSGRRSSRREHKRRNK